MNSLKIFYLYLFFVIIKSSSSNEIKVVATNKVITQCENGLYKVEIIVNYSSPFDKYYSFILNLESPLELKLKCFISYQNSSIICFGNLNSNKFDLEIGEFIKFPKVFPKLENIVWDYDSFVKNIYEKEWIITNDCLQKSFSEHFLNENWTLIINITSIYENKCSYSVNPAENKYNFKMKVNILDGNLKNKIESNELQEIEFLQDIWVPILINTKLKTFRKVNDLSFSFCSVKEKITKSNLENLIFDCHILIPERSLLIGIIQILPFYDYIFMKNKNEIIFDKIYFNINRTIEQETEPQNNNNNFSSKKKSNFKRRNDDENNLSPGTQLYDSMNNNKTTQNNENNEIDNKNTTITPKKKDLISINYFLIGDEINKIYCPDKPIFSIRDINKNIQLLKSDNSNYTIGLRGILSNGLQEVDNKYIALKELYNEITFSLQVIDNLAENEDNQKAELQCTIPIGSPFYKVIVISCNGNKISEESMSTNDTDILLNWEIEKNRLHKDVIIKWPNTKRKSKHIYSYNIQGFSMVQKNYGCYNNEFYFYIYIYDLDHEPDISFELQMKNPTEPKAKCKFYESSILKCYFPLYKQKLEKSTKIDLPINYTYNSKDENGNIVNFFVDDYDYDYDDFHITVRQTCGDNFIVGALKKAGFNYFKVFMIVIGIGVFAFIVFVCFIFFIIYLVKHRNVKGNYIRHIEEDVNSVKKMDIISSRNPEK